MTGLTRPIKVTIFLITFLLPIYLLNSENVINKYSRYEKLLRNAKYKGHIKVIVKMNVPQIDKLTAESNSFKTGSADKLAIASAHNADQLLDEAISTTRNHVLHKLNGQMYQVNHIYSTLPFLALDLTPAALGKLITIPEVSEIYEDRLLPLPPFWKNRFSEEIGNDPQLNQSRDIIGADDAWALGYTGEGWYVAILDTGIRKTHDLFQGKIIIEQCYSAERDCPNGQTQMSGSGSAEHYESEYYGFDHGTHISGIAAGNNTNNIFGVAKDANIIAIQIFSRFPAEECDGEPCVMAWSSDEIKGLEFVYRKRNDYNIAAANLSLGGNEKFTNQSSCDNDPVNALVKDAIDNLRAVGIATVISAGNESYCDGISSPACISSAIAVGATTKQDTEAYFNNWDDILLDILAPGVSIYSGNGDTDSSYGSGDGTSTSAPHVAGALAIFRQFDSEMSISDVLENLQNKGQLITNTRCGHGQQQPRLDIGNTILNLLAIAPPLNFNVNQQVNQTLLLTEYINTLSWDANPLNQDKNIVAYRIYTRQGEDMNLLVELDSNTSEYLHRKVQKEVSYSYAITAVDNENNESHPAYVILD